MPLFKYHRKERLVYLPRDGLFAVEEIIFDQLLRKRRAALHYLHGKDIFNRRAHDADGINPLVLEKALILYQDHRLDQMPRHIF